MAVVQIHLPEVVDHVERRARLGRHHTKHKHGRPTAVMSVDRFGVIEEVLDIARRAHWSDASDPRQPFQLLPLARPRCSPRTRSRAPSAHERF